MLSPGESAKLVRILDRLESAFDGERAAAGLLATRLLRKHGMRWADLIRTAEPPAPRPAASAPSWRTAAAFCRRHAATLTPWELDFISGLEQRSRPHLSSKQAAVLLKIVDRLTREASRG